MERQENETVIFQLVSSATLASSRLTCVFAGFVHLSRMCDTGFAWTAKPWSMNGCGLVLFEFNTKGENCSKDLKCNCDRGRAASLGHEKETAVVLEHRSGRGEGEPTPVAHERRNRCPWAFCLLGGGNSIIFEERLLICFPLSKPF